MFQFSFLKKKNIEIIIVKSTNTFIRNFPKTPNTKNPEIYSLSMTQIFNLRIIKFEKFSHFNFFIRKLLNIFIGKSPLNQID